MSLDRLNNYPADLTFYIQGDEIIRQIDSDIVYLRPEGINYINKQVIDKPDQTI